jgi:AraC family transcriptional regulator of adaptative response / DNA-3-methyladenine glycosylase II
MASTAAPSGATPTITLRLALREPFAAQPLFEFLAARSVPGIEHWDGTVYRRSLRLPHGDATVELSPCDGHVRAVFALDDLRDLTVAVARCRHLCNLDANPAAVDAVLGADRLLRPLVRRTPGRRVPGAADPFEMAVRAVVGQQVSVAGARTVTGRLVAAAGQELKAPQPSVTHTFPSPEALAELATTRPEAFPMPASRRRAVQALAEAVAAEKVVIDPGADPAELEEGLRGLPGIGPWTSSYIAMRAIGDPDAFLPTDLGIRRALAHLGQPDDVRSVTEMAQAWRPWRAYALAHLWSVPTAQPVPARSAGSATAPDAPTRPRSRSRTTPGPDLKTKESAA